MISNYDWMLGQNITKPVILLANKFKTLIKQEAESYFHIKVLKYSPWLSAKYSRDLLKELSINPPRIEKGQLITNRKILEILSNAFTQVGKHAVASIVPQDIGTKIYTGSNLNLSKWDSVIKEARKLLSKTVPWIEDLYSEMIDCVVPIEHKRDGTSTKRGFSTPLCYGAFFLSFEDRLGGKNHSRVEMAIDLSHELGHHVLHTYQTADRIISGDLEIPVYSSVRMTDRPAIMSLHASSALAYMLETAFALLNSKEITEDELEFIKLFIKKYYPEQKTGLKEIEEKCKFTELGQQLFNEMKNQIQMMENSNGSITSM